MGNRILFSILIASLFGCSSNGYNNALREPVNKSTEAAKSIDAAFVPVAAENNRHEYAFIVGHIQKDESSFIEADDIQYLTGQAAVSAAVKRHEADSFQTEDGKTHVDVPNDYFIINDNKKIRLLCLSKNCSIELVINPEATPPIRDNTLQSLKKVDKESPFLLTINEKGMVIKIKEIFVP
jgi:hypothetical protein